MIYYDVRICACYVHANKRLGFHSIDLKRLQMNWDPDDWEDRHSLLMAWARDNNNDNINNALAITHIYIHHRADRGFPCLVCQELKRVGSYTEMPPE